LEIVDRTHSIPYEIAGDGIPDEGWLQARFGMFCRGRRRIQKLGVAGHRTLIFQALTLTNRIVVENCEPISREGRRKNIVSGFTLHAMSRGDHQGGKFVCPFARLCIRQIEQSGHRKVGLGVEDNFFDMEAAVLNGSDGSGVERSLLRKAANETKYLFANFRLAGFSLPTRGNRCDRYAPGAAVFW
jgi:hypothetical protein